MHATLSGKRALITGASTKATAKTSLMGRNVCNGSG